MIEELSLLVGRTIESVEFDDDYDFPSLCVINFHMSDKSVIEAVASNAPSDAYIQELYWYGDNFLSKVMNSPVVTVSEHLDKNQSDYVYTITTEKGSATITVIE